MIILVRILLKQKSRPCLFKKIVTSKMVVFKLESGLCLSDKQIGIISNVLRDKGFENETVTIEPVGKADDNFAANVQRFTVSKEDETFKMVGKVAPNVPQLRATLNTATLFKNEHYMYREVLPKYQELEKAANVPENERLRFATCYGTLIDENHELILLEDLKELNFTILDKQVSFTDKTVKLVLTNFARLHSLSHVLKYKAPEYYNALKKKLSGFEIITESNHMISMFHELGAEVGNLLKDHKYGNIAQQAVHATTTENLKKIKINRESEYSVIQQGDAWTNNIMFQTRDGIPTTCCLIDYQLSNCNSAVSDLLYMILGSTDYETRSKHFRDWINFYHEELDKYLSYHGLRASKVYPLDQLNADLKSHGLCGIGIAILISSMIMRETKETEKFKDAMNNEASLEVMLDMSKLSMMGSSGMDKFMNRLLGLLKTGEEFEFF